jgi:FkbM family methyltransferase
MMKKILKSIYKAIPLKQQLFRLIKVFWKPPHRIYKHLHFKGIIKIMTGESSFFRIYHHGFEIENSLFWEGVQGGWEKESVNLWKKLSKGSAVVFDIGANTGVFSLITASLNGDCQVHAFEPVNRVHEKLVRNVQLNGYNIQCNEMAVSDHTGEAVIYDTMGEHILSVTVNKNLQEEGKNVKPVQISTIRLDEYIRNKKIEKIDLMKIDVETHEAEVLQGMGEYLSRYRPTLIIEILNDEVGSKVEQIVKNHDYLYFNINEDRGISQTDNIHASDHFNYLLCQENVAKQLALI